MKKVVIMTDSSAGFSILEQKKYNVVVIPLMISINSNKSFKDNDEINDTELFNFVVTKRATVKTSQALLGDLEALWDDLLLQYEIIVFLPLAKEISGQYHTALMLCKEEKYCGRIILLDTKNTSFILKTMVLATREYLNNDGDLNKIQEDIINPIQQTSDAYIIPGNLQFLAIGGRIPKSIANIANLLKVKPILQCKDKITKVGVTRTLSRALKNVVMILQNNHSDRKIKKLYVLLSWCDDKTINLIKKVALKYQINNIEFLEMANILKVHLGNNTITLITVP
ncbi:MULTISPECIES: DegV family protein [unclassified Spiroplasma]|uniref:DegV family protein n=1 Tax=unclassified Spiroplasma TaxID=2637901 RepID=UPI00313AE4B6